mgnify:CR=1 FL=1
MPIRLSGMVSGMDTETLVSALVSGYKLKKDNLVKAQTKLSWKQEKWKTMNTSIYSFYSGKLSAGRLSNAYSLKKSTVSNSTVATVTASSSAVAGTQSLKVKKLASSGYLTGGTVKDGKANITGSSKLSDITGSTSQGSVTLSVDGKSTTIELTEDMTVNQFVVKLKDAGVQASFDENNQRFFISSKTSGEKGDFTLVANDTDGMSSLQQLGLYTSKSTVDGAEVNSPEIAEYEKWAGYYNSDGTYAQKLQDIIDSAYESQKTDFDTVAKEMLDKYNQTVAKIKAFDIKFNPDNDTFETKYGDTALKQAEGMLNHNKEELSKNYEDKYQTDGKFDINLIKDEEEKKKYNELMKPTATPLASRRVNLDNMILPMALQNQKGNGKYLLLQKPKGVKMAAVNVNMTEEEKKRLMRHAKYQEKEKRKMKQITIKLNQAQELDQESSSVEQIHNERIPVCPQANGRKWKK